MVINTDLSQLRISMTSSSHHRRKLFDNLGQSCINHIISKYTYPNNYITNYTAKLREFQKTTNLERKAADWKQFGLVEKK